MVTKLIERIDGLREIAPHYEAILCDVWGVLHNGVEVWSGAVEALSAFRRDGGHVVMITNAPRPHGPVLAQLAKLGVPDGVFNVIQGDGQTGSLLATHQGCDKLSFTGSVATGKALMRTGAEGHRLAL